VAVESPPEAGAIWFDNWILDATIATSIGARALYPTTNLLTPHRSETWRSPESVALISGAVFDMGTVRTPTCLALASANFSGTFLQLLGADDASLATNLVNFTLPLYVQDDSAKVLRWYLGTPTSGSMGSSTNPADAASARGRKFWCVRMLPLSYTYDTGDDDFFEIGAIFLGEYTNITPEQGVRISASDPSDRQRAYGRAQWSDPIRPYHEIDLTVGGMTFSELYTLKRKIVAQGSRHAILDVHAYSTDAVVKGGGCFYGYFSDDPVSGRLESPTDNELSISFEEASG
jgi:hypothetical protein